VLHVSSGFFLGVLRRSLLYLRCNWVALNLRFFDIYNIIYLFIFLKSFPMTHINENVNFIRATHDWAVDFFYFALQSLVFHQN
jgi:hypothetical protein